jgi:acetoacetyl-CoA synthetase
MEDATRFLRAAPAERPSFERVPFDSPAYVLYSSGTTGKPKCIVHGVGGSLLQISKELQLHCDLRPGEKIFYYTTCGWMMWNWVVPSLQAGAKLYTYEGSPFAPEKESLWKLVDEEGIRIFGTSAKYLAACRASGLHPRASLPLKELRLVLSTGSPLLPEDFDWFYDEIATDKPLPLASISGGTDIVSCFMLGTPLKPVLRGEIQGRGLGMAVQAFDSQGQPVVGRQGELVCVKPFPSMPVSFWGDGPDRAKYRKAYFERFPGAWHHGDFITITPEGGLVVHGRSDATLNPGGVRIGTAEIYQQVEAHPAVADSLVVGQKWDGDERIVLFVKLKEGAPKFDEELVREIKDRVRKGASPRHVPAKVVAVEEIPYTLSGKKVELAVKRVIHGEPVDNVEALANPKSLELYRNLPELKT